MSRCCSRATTSPTPTSRRRADQEPLVDQLAHDRAGTSRGSRPGRGRAAGRPRRGSGRPGARRRRRRPARPRRCRPAGPGGSRAAGAARSSRGPRRRPGRRSPGRRPRARTQPRRRARRVGARRRRPSRAIAGRDRLLDVVRPVPEVVPAGAAGAQVDPAEADRLDALLLEPGQPGVVAAAVLRRVAAGRRVVPGVLEPELDVRRRVDQLALHDQRVDRPAPASRPAARPRAGRRSTTQLASTWHQPRSVRWSGAARTMSSTTRSPGSPESR